MKPRPPHVCGSCGDPCVPVPADQLPREVRDRLPAATGTTPVVVSLRGRPRCFECLVELTTGQIPPADRITGVPTIGGPAGQPGPAAADAVGPRCVVARRRRGSG